MLSGAVMALAIGVMTGCSDNLAVDDGQGKVDRDQTRYLNVTIVNPSAAGSRATTDGNFQLGTPAENFVSTMTFVFYDAQGLPTGQAVDYNFTENGADQGFTSNTASQNVEKIWTSTVPVVLAQGENLPSYVIAYINPISTAELKTRSLAELDNVLRQQVRHTNGNFPMANSVYYGNNPVSGASNVRVFATPISTDQLFTSVSTAQAATNSSVNIYVERYAARVQLNMTPAVISANTKDVNGYSLKFVPEAWRVNATDKDIFAVKRFGIVGEDGVVDYDPTFTALNNRLGSWWNEPGKFRSYWATTPSYYADEYPTVSDNITDVAEYNDYRGTGDAAYPYDEHYFNYNQFANGTVTGATFPAAITWDDANGFNQPFYARETTTSSTAWSTTGTGYNPLATIASAVIIGHYELTATGAVAPVPANDRTFYLYGKTGGKHNLYFEDAILGAMVAQQSVVLKRNGTDGNYTYTEYRDETGFTVKHPEKAVRDVKGTTVAGRLVALQLDGTNLANLYYYDPSAEGDKYVAITADNINKVNSDLLAAGYATKYGKGLAYFNIPIEHLGIYTNIDGANTGTYVTGAKNADGTYDFSKCPAGSFGVVRNHAYTINVTGVSGLATALRDENQPIVPPVDEVTYYISAKLNILSWRIVPAQEVEL